MKNPFNNPAGKVNKSGDTMTGNLEFSDGKGVITPIITESTTARTLALTDAFSLIRTTNEDPTAITVPLNDTVAFPIGTQIDFIQNGAGQLSFVATGGVTINAPTLLISARYKGASIFKVGSNEWDLIIG